MTRKLIALGLASAVVLTLAVLQLSSAGATTEEEAVPVYFAVGVGNEETAKIDANQIGSNTLTVSGSPPLKCETIEYHGEAVNPGNSSNRVVVTPVYSGCSVVVFGVKKTATVAVNECKYEIVAQETVIGEARSFVGETSITCPTEKQIEINVYNTSNAEHAGSSTLCTYKIKPQSGLTGTTLTNKESDIVADFAVKSIAGSGSGFCTGGTATYEGEVTIRATNNASEFVSAQIGNKKRITFDIAKPVVKGEKGEVEIGTEKVTINCTGVEYEANPGVAVTAELAFKPTYPSCTAFGGKNEVQIKPESCVYKSKFNKDIEFPIKGVGQTPSSFEVSCGAKESVKITVTKPGDKVNVECSIVIPAQKPVDTLKFRNNRSIKSGLKVDTLILIHAVTGLNYEPQNNAAVCGKNQLLTDGKITEGPTNKEFLVKASDGKGKEINALIQGTMAP
jgi:hypothetical protein